MSWFNFNDSLNIVKGQISNLANNVLADGDEEQEITGSDYKQLQELCRQQELEIKKLRKINEELNDKPNQPHDASSNGSWNWDDDPSAKASAETVSDLRKQIQLLETEKTELVGQLDQLDADNQENLANIMEMKEKLQFQLNDVNENYLQVQKENKKLAAREQSLKQEIEKLQLIQNGELLQGNKEECSQKVKELTEENDKLNKELESLKTELENMKASNENLQKVIEDAKHLAEPAENEQIKKLEGENKLIYSELKKANEKISTFEKKSIEDEENCQKLAIILETYEEQVSCLKEESKSISICYEEAKSKLNENEKAFDSLKAELATAASNHEQELSLLATRYTNLVKELKAILDGYKQEEIDETELTSTIASYVKDLKAEVHNQKRELDEMKPEMEELKKLNDDLLVRATGRMDRELESELEDIQREHEVQINVLREELDLLRKEESKNITDTEKFETIEEEKLALSRELKDLQEQLEELKENHKVSLQSLHKKYASVISESVKNFEKCDNPLNYQLDYNIDLHDEELNKCINDIIKTFTELKCKSIDLEKRLHNVVEEKNVLLQEKDKDIEDLMQNSERLQQEISANAQIIKEIENECKQLAANNELLITELESYKNNPGLQTISETNEDNMILLENQLENSNRRIEDLEKIIDDLERSQMRKDSLEDSSSDLENAVKQLNLTETEILHKNKDYQELLSHFDQLQVEYESLKNELEEAKENLVFTNEESVELKSVLEKIRTDNENMEYQLSELNINAESMKDEIEEYKNKFKMLLSENSNIKLQSDENLKKYLDFESKVGTLEEKLVSETDSKRELESQIEVITEKLKNSKMTETSLKLQLEQKSKELAAQTEERYNLEIALNKINADLSEFQNNFIELQNQNDKLVIEKEELLTNNCHNEQKVKELEVLVKDLEEKLIAQQNQADNVQKEIPVSSETSENSDHNNLKLILDQTVLEKANLQAELNKLTQVQTQLKEATEKSTVLQNQLQEITNSRNELINMVTMKHQENVTYHNEIQKLNQVLITEAEKYKALEAQMKQSTSTEDVEAKNSEIEKLTDQNNFLKEKCEILAKNLLEEQAKTQKLISERSVPSEKETALQKKVDRLQAHLIELEEHYTQELLQAEQKNTAMKAKVADIEEREKSTSTMYTSVSIRANQQVESLQSQLQAAVAERDSLRKQISDAEDENTKQSAALANLQFVLEQFRKDKEQDVIRETERIRRHINTEKQVQEELRKEISNLQAQLEERNQGLLAASRLSDQLESSKKTIVGLKDEVSQLQTKLSKTEENLSNALSSTDGKVDKLLIKNLILGFVTSNNNLNRDQSQILKIIATVLDFNQQDHDKVKLNKPQQGWLSSLLAPNPDTQSRMTEESLSRAFIQFLENESKPRVIPSLLDANTSTPSNSSTKTTNSRSTTPKQTPIVLSEIVLPTFSDFAQNRNSSSILKDVLKDNS